MRFWHNGVLTPDIDKTIEFFCASSGIPLEKWAISDMEFPQSNVLVGKGGKLRRASAFVGDVVIELIQPLDGTSYHADALSKRGSGFHHNAYICENDYDEVIDSMIASGGRIVWAVKNGNDHACYIEAPDGGTVLEIINHCPFMPEK